MDAGDASTLSEKEKKKKLTGASFKTTDDFWGVEVCQLWSTDLILRRASSAKCPAADPGTLWGCERRLT